MFAFQSTTKQPQQFQMYFRWECVSGCVAHCFAVAERRLRYVLRTIRANSNLSSRVEFVMLTTCFHLFVYSHHIEWHSQIPFVTVQREYTYWDRETTRDMFRDNANSVEILYELKFY